MVIDRDFVAISTLSQIRAFELLPIASLEKIPERQPQTTATAHLS